MDSMQVRLALEDRGYDPMVVRQYMEENPRETAAAVLDALREDKICFGDERGRAAGREVIDWYRQHMPSEETDLKTFIRSLFSGHDPFLQHMPGEETDLVTKDFYRAVSDIHQDLLDVWSHAVGCFCAACTLGYVPALPISRRIQRWSQRRYIDRLLYPDEAPQEKMTLTA